MGNIAASAIIKGEQMVEDETGLTVVRQYLVENLSGTNVLYDALAVVPAYGQPHDVIPNSFVTRREPKPFAENARTQANVFVTYRPPDFSNLNSPIVRFSATTQDHETSYDATGKLITVDFTSTGNTSWRTQVAQVRGTKAMGLLTYDYISAAQPNGFVNYLDKISSQTFFGWPKYHWLCCEVEISKQQFRAGWAVHIGFLLDTQSHVRVAAYRTLNGIIPKGISANVDTTQIGPLPGVNRVLTNKTADFNALKLPQVF